MAFASFPNPGDRIFLSMLAASDVPALQQFAHDVAQLTGCDGSSFNYSRAQLADREARLNANVHGSLMHQAGAAGTRGIICSGGMRPGKTGIAGAAIYFAISADDTMHKAHNHGFMFTVRVRLGNVEQWPGNKVD